MNAGAVPDSGRQIKVISLMLTEIAETHVFNPPDNIEDDEDGDEKGYQGATVIDTVKGFYGGPLDQIVLLDFASLYPSIMLAHCVSPDRYVRRDRPKEVEASRRPGVVVTAHDVGVGEPVLLASRDPESKPYFCRVLRKLLSERAAVRKVLKGETDPGRRAVLDARQIAKKVSCNSAYGLLGAKKGYMPLPDLAAVVTYQGRQALEFSKGVAEREFGARTIAGDSVADYTPIHVRYEGVYHIVIVESLPELFPNGGWDADDHGKELCVFSGLDTWSDGGWTPLRHLVRHALDPAKRMFRVLTHTGLVDVTEDHSLLAADGSPVRPSEVSIGDELLHADLPPPLNLDTGISVDEAAALGGSRPVAVPREVLAGGEPVRRAFLRSLLAAGPPSGDQLFLAEVFHLAAGLGVPVRLAARGVLLAGCEGEPSDALAELHPIEYPADAFVYDLSTGDEHFSAGVGRLVVHNTDSVMVTLPAQEGVPTPVRPDEEWKRRRMEFVFDLAERVGDTISARLPAELVFELEGVMYPACFYKKKNYAAVLWKNPRAPEAELKMRGVAAVRNDWSLLCKKAATEVLRRGIQANDPEGAVAYLREIVRKMNAGELPVSDFVISKQLHSLDPKTISPHVALCRRLLKTAPDEVPALGSKVEFVIVKGFKDLSDASRRPEDVRPGDIDTAYYFERQLLKPLVELMGPLIRGGEQTLRRLLVNDKNKQSTLYECLAVEPPALEDIRREAEPERKAGKKQKTMSSYFGFT